ncbi:CsbD family protein [Streptomyces spectabilis]|uniref:CsbD family protein n=1 Tax=Streptomyces spectabilis TaxID=68270 RepID=A0A516RIQ5_STRST|nr:CsbD family protein [Streptomyces spectabilis]QDQ15546.1 CsbD family protein [Streptomyces spectabilis]
MSTGHPFRNKAQDLKGRITERIGRAARNRRLQREGRTDRISGNLKQSGDKIKNAFHR